MMRSSRALVWVLMLALAVGGCWGRRRHRAPRTRPPDPPEATSQVYDPPAPPRPPAPPPPPPSPSPSPPRGDEPVSSEGPPTLVSRFRSTGGNRCPPPSKAARGGVGELFSVDGVDSTDVLNVRVEPDWRSDIVGKLPPDTRGVIGLGERQRVGTASWRKVACGTVRGWVNDKFLARETAAR